MDDSEALFSVLKLCSLLQYVSIPDSRLIVHVFSCKIVYNRQGSFNRSTIAASRDHSQECLYLAIFASDIYIWDIKIPAKN